MGCFKKTDTLQKVYRWQISIRKYAPHSISSRKCKLKQYDTRYRYTFSRTAKTQNTDSTQCWWERGATETLTYFWWGCKMVQPLQKPVQHFSTKLKYLYHDSVIFSLVFIWKYWKGLSTQKFARGRLQQLYAYLPKTGSNQDVFQ